MTINKEALYRLVDNVEQQDYDIVFQVLLRFIPVEEPYPDEIEAIRLAKDSISKHGTVRHEDVDWGL